MLVSATSTAYITVQRIYYYNGIDMKIREAKETDAVVISTLVLNSARAHIRREFSDDGWELFQRLSSADCQRELLRNKQYNFLVAEQHKEVIGMLAIKDISHIFQLFISTDFQRQGVGTALWKQYLHSLKSGKLSKPQLNKVTLNASDFGKGFYLKLGFKIAGERRLKQGVYINPLSYSLTTSNLIR